MLDESLQNANILIVDDQEANIDLLVRLLENKGYSNLKSTTDSRQVVALLNEFQPDLILLDLMMPHLDGFQVMEQLKSLIPADTYLPILVLTADITTEAKRHALAIGARDFLTKPLDVTQVALRIKNLLEARYMHLQLKKQNQVLEVKVSERTADLRRANVDLTLAYDSTIEGWSRALDLRDKETEGHSHRVTEMASQLARLIGLGEAEIVHVRRGALLHDIGKMGVPDSILLKAGKLTDDEWIQMKKHPQFARDLLAPIGYLRSALDIPFGHHEKGDGTGYPLGLKGEQIPLVARLFAIVDVYDALTSDRPYRAAWSVEQTVEHIMSLAGSHFDPHVVDIFLRMTRDQLRMDNL
ncbi:MAG: response regulator [Dehalococcoidia bacterium]|nr:response regulator [Dehalococcoidia bacterium]